MKTTIDITEPLLKRARTYAARNGVTLKALVERGLRQILAERDETPSFHLRKASFKGLGLQPGVRNLNWDEIREKASPLD